MKSAPIAIDLFAGCGGITEGLKQAGFSVVVANEIQHHAAMTYAFNHPETKVLEKDIRNVEIAEIMDIAGSFPFLVAGGPPCQGFSMAGRRNPRDPRNELPAQFVKMIQGLEPKFFLMENVPGMLSMDKGRIMEGLQKSFEEAGYFVTKRIFNAADFGIPQLRKRVFIFGCKRGNHDINSMKYAKMKTPNIEEAIGDLDFLGPGEKSARYLCQPKTPYQTKMRNGTNQLFNHDAPKHSATVVTRFSKLKPGQTQKDLKASFRTKKMVLYRFRREDIARTITTLPEDFVHYSQPRILTVREFARLQSFQDSYIFFGPKATGGLGRKKDCPQYSQVANAVPPLLMREVGKWITSLN